MSKELTPLEALKIIKSTWNCFNPDSSETKEEHFSIIEAELKELEQDLKDCKDVVNEYLDKIVEQNEILRIIKEKRVVVSYLMFTCGALDYNVNIYKYAIYDNHPLELTEKEYDLLKEWLK